MSELPSDAEYPPEIIRRRNEFCARHSRDLENRPPGVGLEAIVWPTTVDTVVKVHRNSKTFALEVAAYQRLAERNILRLKGFSVPQLIHYDSQLDVVELSFVFPPYILDFGAANTGKKPSTFNLDVVETEFGRQFGNQWPEVRRLLEALMQIGIYYQDAHNRNIVVARR